MSRHKTVWCETFGRLPHRFAFCPSERAWKDLQRISKRDLGRYPPLELAACCTLLRDYKNDRRVAIVTIATKAPRLAAELLIHEAVHVWQDLRTAIGEENPSSEFEAYGLQHITSELFLAYEKTRTRLFSRPLP